MAEWDEKVGQPQRVVLLPSSSLRMFWPKGLTEGFLQWLWRLLLKLLL